jgi:uncharacterized protein YdeI (YjbR/CyaY-like superfamily)
VDLDRAALRRLNANAKAWRFWQAQIPSYRKMIANWVSSAKREETRARRLAMLIDSCERGKVIPPLAKLVKAKQPG